MSFADDVDGWINGDLSAIVLREHLIPVEGKEAPFFPPTFAGTGDEKSTYCIDNMKDGTRTCLIDTVGSQANRMEPIFMEEPYKSLIPQVRIKVEDEEVDLCEVGHRLADALLRNSTLNDTIKEVLTDLKHKNAMPIAKIAPTSLVFGLWDSRGTQVKIPRIVSSVIRAYDIDELSRSAQYFPPVKYSNDEILGAYKDKKEMDARSSLGFHDNPSVNVHGGIIAHGGIQRDVVINITALRKITADSEQNTSSLQRYILGITMVAAFSLQEWNLRAGCLLVKDQAEKSECSLVFPDGRREEIKVNHEQVFQYAQKAAKKFGVGDNVNGEFKKSVAKKEIESKSKSKDKKQ